MHHWILLGRVPPVEPLGADHLRHPRGRTDPDVVRPLAGLDQKDATVESSDSRLATIQPAEPAPTMM